MIFNSLSFSSFFILFFFFYWFIFHKNLKFQNLLILIGSYVFYAWADWRFLPFLIGVSALNFFLGIYIEKTTNQKYKRLLKYIGLIQGIGGLVFFKYYNFFIASFNEAFHSLSINLNLQTLNIIIPLGISFFTFRTISYVLDVEKGKIEASKDWIVFFTYVSFFPSLLSGPIDKARTLIPQLEKKRAFDYEQTKDGLRQILWGLFKKVVIADNCAEFANTIFNNSASYSGITLALGALFFTIQLYCDFSGYSDMAIGISRLIGFNITRNFDFPFFAQNIAEFWRKWHISLTAWLTEYVFTPLNIAFRNYGKTGIIIAIIINITLMGIWHGANWNYVLFGFLHGCYFIPLILRGTMNKKKKIAKGKLFPSLKEFINVLLTFVLVTITFIVFRADNIPHAFTYISKMFMTFLSKSSFVESWNFVYWKIGFALPFYILFFISIEWIGREQQHALVKLGLKWYKPIRWVMYYCIIFLILYYVGGAEKQFIYFQF